MSATGLILAGVYLGATALVAVVVIAIVARKRCSSEPTTEPKAAQAGAEQIAGVLREFGPSGVPGPPPHEWTHADRRLVVASFGPAGIPERPAMARRAGATSAGSVGPVTLCHGRATAATAAGTTSSEEQRLNPGGGEHGHGGGPVADQRFDNLLESWVGVEKPGAGGSTASPRSTDVADAASTTSSAIGPEARTVAAASVRQGGGVASGKRGGAVKGPAVHAAVATTTPSKSRPAGKPIKRKKRNIAKHTKSASPNATKPRRQGSHTQSQGPKNARKATEPTSPNPTKASKKTIETGARTIPPVRRSVWSQAKAELESKSPKVVSPRMSMLAREAAKKERQRQLYQNLKAAEERQKKERPRWQPRRVKVKPSKAAPG